MRTALARTDRYSTGAIWFHWIIAALIVFNIVVGLFHDSVPALRALMPAHKAVGITVIVLTLARIAWRLANPTPPLPAAMPAWERATAIAVRWLFYILLFVMPLSGWAMVSGGPHPRPLSWFGLFPIPLLPVSNAASGVGAQAHLIGGYLFAALVVLHVLGALRHQFVLHDSVLGRMIPALVRD